MQPTRAAVSAAQVAQQETPTNGTATAAANGTTTTDTTTTGATTTEPTTTVNQFVGTTNKSQTVEEIHQIVPPWIPNQVVDLALAVLVFAVAWYGSKLFIRLIGRRIARRFNRPSITRTVIRGIRVGTLVLATFVVATVIYGFEPGNLLLSVTVFSAVLGLVLAPLVGSVINGVFVLADQPYEIGDLIELADRNQRGYVEDITIRYTKIFTLDNTFIVVPNSGMRERDVINYSAEDPRTRLALDILVTYESDVDAARDLIERAARDVENVITGGPDIRIGSARYPAAPTCYVEEFADHGINLRLQYWVKNPYKLLTDRSRIQERVEAALEDADVEIAYPHSHLVFDDTSGTMRVDLDERGQGGPRGPPSDRLGGDPGGDRQGGRRTGGRDRTGDREPTRDRDPERDREDG